MSRAVGNPALGPFLQAKVKEWLAVHGRTQKQLAEQAGLSTAQVSDVKNKAVGVGYLTARSIGRVLGYKDMGALEAAAEEWARSVRLKSTTEPPSRREQPRLKDRPDWATVVENVRAAKPYLTDESLQRVGRIQDSEVDFPDEDLDPDLIGNLAHAFFAHDSKTKGKP